MNMQKCVEKEFVEVDDFWAQEDQDMLDKEPQDFIARYRKNRYLAAARIEGTTYEQRLEGATHEVSELRRLLLEHGAGYEVDFYICDESIEFSEHPISSVGVKVMPYLSFYVTTMMNEKPVEEVVRHLQMSGAEYEHSPYGDLTALPLAWTHSLYMPLLKPLSAEHEQALRASF